MSQITLRPYQQAFIDAIRDQFKRVKRVVGVAPCGAGKTVITGWMIRETLKRGKRSIFFVHRHELIEQTANTFNRLDIPFGIIAGGIPMQPELPVQIASVQTLAKRLDRIVQPDFLICDECHHILANTYHKIIDKFKDAFLLGVTATPLRRGGITLADSFDSMVLAPSVNELINLGCLTKFNYYAPETKIDLSRVKTVHGDFDNHQLEEVMLSSAITGDIVVNYRRFADGLKAICYCVNVKHSKSVADAFNKAGIPAAHCDGETNPKVRAQLVNDFRGGRINVLCNAELFGEGFDVPDCQAVILARPTQSLTLFIQQAMRPLRPDPNNPNKVAVIIDHVQNSIRHGLPNDYHDWSLQPNLKKKLKCPGCGKMVTPVLDKKTGNSLCPKCGFVIREKSQGDSPSPRGAAQLDGELKQLNVQFDTQNHTKDSVIDKPTDLVSVVSGFLKTAQSKRYKLGWVAFNSLDFAKSYEDCIYIARACGYKDGWAWHQWKNLQC